MRSLYKKDGRKEKSNYRPISILSNVSKVHRSCLYDHIYDFFENTFLRYQRGFRKVFNTQNALLSVIEKMLLACGKKEISRVILTDLSKAFDCIGHDLLIAKLNAYGFDQWALNVIHNYLFGRMGSSFSDLLDILYGVPQGSIFGPFLFNINLCDLSLSGYSSEFTNFEDDTTPYEYGETCNEVINKLEDTIEKLFKWF